VTACTNGGLKGSLGCVVSNGACPDSVHVFSPQIGVTFPKSFSAYEFQVYKGPMYMTS
jgi:hypothetical protein